MKHFVLKLAVLIPIAFIFWVVGLEILRGVGIDKLDFATVLGSWFAAIATSFAAYYTGRAALASAQAAKAAEQSNRQWREQASFDIYVPKAAQVKTKLMWIHGSIMQVANTNFQGVNLPDQFTVELFRKAVNSEFEPNNKCLFEKYIKIVEFNNNYIKDHLLDALYLLDETFILSKDYCSLNSTEIITIERVIRQLILHLRVISFTYEKVINRDTNSTSIDACFNCSDSTKHYVKTYEQRYKLVDAFLEMLVSSRDVEAWEKAKENYIKCQKDSKNLFAQENPEMQESLKKHYEGLFG